ncbi:MAG: beta-lactamase family protein [Candidatus Omnitrophica bacterium]|jgi:D-alanyl-D-alanine carboxypeptidase|nr:beta-lactamase family protein [Candidatus Omnitrophota bacterium]
MKLATINKYLRITILTVILPLVNIAIEPSVYCQTIRQAMDKIVTNTIKEKNIPGAIVGVWSPSVGVWVKTFGEADVGSGRSMHDKKKVRIGSVTQTFLISALLSLVDDKKINLDDPVNKYIPFVPNGGNITIRQLANNTSGIFNYTEDAQFFPQVIKSPLREYQPLELVNIAFKHGPYFKPGQGWHASDTNFILLGMIMEKVTSEKLEDLIRLRVINRIGLKNTSFAIYPFMEGDYSRGYVDKKDSNIPQDITLLDPSSMWAAGAIVSDIQDLSLWAKALYKGSFLTDKMRAARFNWVATGEPYLQYGLGISKFGDFVGYSGGIPGYACVMYYLSAKDTTIIVILNKFPDNGAAISIFKALAKTVIPDYVPW